jgi:hypothetical protein
MVFGENLCHQGAGLFGAVLVIVGDKDNVFAFSDPLTPLVN